MGFPGYEEIPHDQDNVLPALDILLARFFVEIKDPSIQGAETHNHYSPIG